MHGIYMWCENFDMQQEQMLILNKLTTQRLLFDGDMLTSPQFSVLEMLR
jgi:hypothetical protein